MSIQTIKALNKKTAFQYLKNQSILLWIFLLPILLIPQFARANAGMLVVVKEDGKTYVLFVQTYKHDYYEFPGGRIEYGESLLDGGSKMETPYETAVGETLEETRGYLGRQQLGSVSSPKQLIKVGKFRILLAKLPFFKINDLLEIKIPKGKKWSPMREVVNYAWVDVNAVQQSDDVTTRDGEKNSLHPIAYHVIKEGRLSHWF